MNSKKIAFICLGSIAALVGWYLFRPELLFVNERVHEAKPIAASSSVSMPVELAMGQFHSVSHSSKGTAEILDLGGGKRVLRLSDFQTSNGPDVRVYLIGAADATDNETVKRAAYVELGHLKGNIGDQNYEIPANVDVSKYHAVTIWCYRFGVNFATAPLMGQRA